MSCGVTCFIGIGSNKGNRRLNISKAIALLAKASSIKIAKISPVYETKAVGFVRQRDFLNLVIKIKTGFSPKRLLSFLKGVEKNIGRKKARRFGPREIDLDILIFGERIVKCRGLKIPHERLHERLFVLRPLADIAPGLVHPVFKKDIKYFLRRKLNEAGKEYRRCIRPCRKGKVIG